MQTPNAEQVIGLFLTSRGAVLLTGCQLLALVCGAVTQIVLARLLAPMGYGLYAVAISVLTWMEIVVHGGFGTVLSKAISEGNASPPAAWSWMKRVYLPYIVLVWLVYNLTAFGFAQWLRDQRLTVLLWIAGTALPFLGFWATVRDLLMGVRAYGLQATVIAGQIVARALFAIGAALATRSVSAVLAANTLGTATAATVAWWLWHRWEHKHQLLEEEPTNASLFGALLGTGLPVLLTSLLFTGTMNIDLWLVKRLMDEPQAAGHYGAARFFGFVPFYFAVGIGTALYPALCHELGRGQKVKAAALTREAVRVFLMVVVPLCAVIWATAPSLVALLFSHKFAAAAEPVRWLTVAYSLCGLMAIWGTALVAGNQATVYLTSAAILSGAAFGFCYWLIPSHGLVGAAKAMVAAWLIGAVLVGATATRMLGWLLPLPNLARIVAAASVLYVLGSLWKATGWELLGEYLALGASYLGLLIVLRELTASDFATLRIVFVDIVASVKAFMTFTHKSQSKRP